MTKPEVVERPAPLVAANVDLRGYDFMPFYGEFLRASDFNSKASADEYRAAVNLWWSSWWQLPAASLPDDDTQLCRLADLGRDTRAWRRVKARAMAGFILCADGRWYHQFLADVATDTFRKRVTASIKGRAGAEKTKQIRESRRGTGTTTATGTGNATATATAIAPASGTSSGPGSGKGREVIPPLPPGGTATAPATSKPKPDSAAIAKTSARIEEQKRAARETANPPGGSVSEFAKRALEEAAAKRQQTPPPAQEPEPEEAIEATPEPTPSRASGNGKTLDPAWANTSEGIDQAGEALGMVRIAYETDDAYVIRINARLHLG